jgi:hypothetical protein
VNASFFYVYFSLAQSKVPKETLPGSLATLQAWLPSRGRFFRRGQKLVRLTANM